MKKTNFTHPTYTKTKRILIEIIILYGNNMWKLYYYVETKTIVALFKIYT